MPNVNLKYFDKVQQLYLKCLITIQNLIFHVSKYFQNLVYIGSMSKIFDNFIETTK